LPESRKEMGVHHARVCKKEKKRCPQGTGRKGVSSKPHEGGGFEGPKGGGGKSPLRGKEWKEFGPSVLRGGGGQRVTRGGRGCGHPGGGIRSQEKKRKGCGSQAKREGEGRNGSRPEEIGEGGIINPGEKKLTE